ncbi:MAG: histidine phosphatase family protein [Pseudomonadota bacterium]|uniref:histidine phosphatase family protein n=1 Tax=Thermithiobacillus tepidarius TaxID=929 RepID=UPI0006886788|nr:histidine phosphatase family protein [Thermithiobacillus tepidarius]
MEIILARHGRSALFAAAPRSRQPFSAWARAYEASGIAGCPAPQAGQQGPLRELGLLVTSDLRRTLESARCLCAGAPLLVDPLFREAGLGSAFMEGVRLGPRTWGALAPALWLLGLPAGAESWRAVRTRAQRAAALLIEQAQRTDTVMLVGHLIFNAFVATELKKRGWRGPALPRSGYWQCSSYRRA